MQIHWSEHVFDTLWYWIVMTLVFTTIHIVWVLLLCIQYATYSPTVLEREIIRAAINLALLLIFTWIWFPITLGVRLYYTWKNRGSQ